MEGEVIIADDRAFIDDGSFCDCANEMWENGCCVRCGRNIYSLNLNKESQYE